MRDIHLVPVSYFPSENLEFPMVATLQTITPNQLFYVRNHFEYPTIDINTWYLSIEELVDQPIKFTFADLKNMNKVTLSATLECAGNKRSLFERKAQGNQFKLGAISNAIWGGVRLKDVLDQAGISPSATEIVFEGLDYGHRNDMDGQVFFKRSLPVAKALHPDTLLAYEMNGEPLSDKHGFPIRLIVPGWYAVASVKWLHRIRVVDQPFKGPFQSIDYVILKKENDYKRALPLSPVLINSTIASPTEEEELAVGTNVVQGYAWAGEHSVMKVEISTDGGTLWTEANILDPDVPYSWRRWSFAWDAQKPGQYTIMSKATNDQGDVQPLKAEWNVKGYQNNSIHAVNVHVTAPDLVNSVNNILQETKQQGVFELLTLEIAKQLLEVAEQKARQMGLAFDIAIVDAGANLVAFHRMDYARIAGIEISKGKAWTSVTMQMPTANLAQSALPGGQHYGVNTTNQGAVTILGGGIPLVHEGMIVGGIGVAGGTMEQDMEVANAAVQAFATVVGMK
ncbi:molybdopterin-dependent oxidoreductase [Paenibacillus sp. MWE-103]|uniref:Molybdopterin-dependent oxidoreductase n=1 Tax=Paenibacillus artemisiicola TaxID=1172618 RepID=A0ABS3WEJ9_9BACL|nr:molybdopterin-dependent oxidoreductase [Paenibacillus artemisiicola]